MPARTLFAAAGTALLAAGFTPTAAADTGAFSRGHAAIPAAVASEVGGASGWLTSHPARVRVDKRTGLAYTRRLDRARGDLVLSLKGPAQHRKRLGLSLEVRF